MELGRVVVNIHDQYTDTPYGLANKRAQQNVTFQYATDVTTHEGAWCDGCYVQHTRLHFIDGNLKGQHY